MQTELSLISVGDRVRFTQDYLAAVQADYAREVKDLQGTVKAFERMSSPRLPTVRVWWDGDDRARMAAIDVLERISE